MLLRATSPPPPSAVSAAASWESSTLRRDGEDDWEEVVAAAPGAGDAEVDSDYKIVFWSPPTGDEVRVAFSSIQEEHMNVLDAFRLLQRDPNVQKMVMSLSCDRTVWDVVMNNEAVREFRRSFHDDGLRRLLPQQLEGYTFTAHTT
ncbi:hypothetical protein ZWY2020_046709 [Hordeum vulgare]|nr:hypothetical protein ZWY2020_046709 [Hordeum vulgare]